MRRVLRWIGWSIAVLAAVLVVLVAALFAGANTQRGRAIVAALAPRLTGGLLTIEGLSGRFPDRLEAAEVSLHDKDGVWCRVDDLDLDWSPSRLFAGVVVVDRLAAKRIAILRRPLPSGGSMRALPVDLRVLHVGRLDLAPAVTGSAASLALDGSAGLGATGTGRADLTAIGISAPGHYHLDARLGAADLDVRLSGREPAHGIVAAIAGLPGLGPLQVDGTFAGPRSAVAGKLELALGAARIGAHGTLDLDGRTADLIATAAAPAMAPRPDLAWRSITFDGRIAGPFARPTVSAKLEIAMLQAAQASVAVVSARLEGNAGALHLDAALSGVRVPGPHPDLLAAAPLRIAAEVRLDSAGRPVQLSLSHPLVTAEGTVWTASPEHGSAKVELPDLAPLAAAAGVDLEGHAVLDLRAVMKADTTRLDADGTIGVTGGIPPVTALVGDAAPVTVAAAITGSNVTISRFEFEGRKLALSAAGQIGAEKLALDWQLGLPDLTAAAPTLAGALQLQGRVNGAPGNLAATANLAGTLGQVGRAPGPITATVRLAGLPGEPTGHLDADGLVLGSPLRLGLAALRTADGGLHFNIEEADWKSAHAKGAFALPAGSRFPLGRLAFRIARLDDLSPLIGRPINGSLTGSLATAEGGVGQRADLNLAAVDLGLAGAGGTARTELDATILDPLAHPVLDARISAAGRAASGAAASARMELKGPEAAVGFAAQSVIHDPKTGDVRFGAAGTVDAVTRVAAISRLDAFWKGQNLRLLQPVRVGFGNGLVLDHLRLGVGPGTIEANGRLTPTLDLSAALRLPAEAAAAFAPGFAADGVVTGNARFTGSLQRPQGQVRLAATGLRLRQGSARALPAANFTATADIAGPSASLDARLAAGPSANLSVRGRVSTVPSALALNATGAVDLKLLDPILTASGQRVTGKLAFDARIGGTLQAPRVDGTVRLADGTIEDYALGVHIVGVSGLVEANGSTIRIARFEGRAGPGTIGLAGTLGLASGMPVHLEVTARNARPLATDLLTATLNADMNLRGQALGNLILGGRVDVLQANVGIPKSMPAAVPVLNVRVAGAPPAPMRSPPPAVGLDLTVAAHRLVVSGRGLFAELAGSVKVGGTIAAPQPLGSFHMVRGNLSIAGQTLNFDNGEVSFNGGSLTDPSLHFVVSSLTATMSAQLVITGTASHPKVAVTSTPELPTDEALARMLYPNSNATPSPLQLASIAASLAELSGATGGGGGLLSGVQQGLGLEQLSIGTAANGSSTLQVGRYVRPGVWVGAQQGAGGNSSQARVEIDIARGLKVFGTVGNGTNTTPGATPAQSAGTSLGLKYQFQY